MPPATAQNARSRPATPVASTPASPAAIAAAAEQLDSVLRQLVTAHEELLKLASAQRSAIARADVRALTDVMAAQSAVADRVVELERHRQAAVATMVKLAAPGGGAAANRMTIPQLVRSLADPMRTRLIAIADRLREILNRLHTEHMALRDAAEALSSHMEGLLRQVCRKLSHAGTYARSGAIDTRSPVMTALDIRS